MTYQEIITVLAERSKASFLAKNYADADFFLDLQYRFKQLLLVANCVARLNEKSRTDEAWEALFEALDDAALLPSEAKAEES